MAVGTLAVKNEIPVKNEISSLRLLSLKMRIVLRESLDNCQNEFSGILCYFYGIKSVKCYRVDN